MSGGLINYIIVRPKAISWVGLIFRTHQYYRRQLLGNTEWSKSRR